MGPIPWDLEEALVIRIAAEQCLRPPFYAIARADQAEYLGDDQPKHSNRLGIGRDRKGDRAGRGVVDVSQQPRLRHLPADHVPRFSDKRRLLKRGDTTWCGEATQEGEEPFAAAVVPEAIDLREVQRQIMRQETVQNLRFGLGDRFMRL